MSDHEQAARYLDNLGFHEAASALRAPASPQPFNRVETVERIAALVAPLGRASGEARWAAAEMVRATLNPRCSLAAYGKCDLPAGHAGDHHIPAPASPQGERARALIEASDAIKATSFAERFLVAQWLRALAAYSPQDNAEKETT